MMENTEARLDEASDPRHALEEVTEQLRSFNERAKSYIKAHPAACLAGAVALGFLVARIARWRS